MNEDRIDDCSYCRAPLEIIALKFGFRGTKIIASCPNCAMAFAENGRNPRPKMLASSVLLAANQEPGMSGMPDKLEQLHLRAKYVIGFLLAAVITAAILRHAIHMYGGVPPAQIRTAALLGVPATIFSIFLLRRRRR
jgi:hypothetical protein